MVALQQVQCLEEVVRTRSFRAAAISLKMSQPAVSGHIARLERELNLTLLERTPAGSTLTPEGERILPHLRAFVDTTEQVRLASEQIREAETTQVLSIVGSTRRLYEALLIVSERMRQTFERFSMRLVTADEDAIGADLRAGRAELGVFPYELGTVGLAHDIEPIPLWSIGPPGLALPHDHPALRTPGPIDVSALAGEHLIIANENRSNELLHRVAPSGAAPVTVVDDVRFGLALVEASMGVMVITSFSAFVENMNVTWRALTNSAEYATALARVRGRELSPVAQAFVDTLLEWRASSPPPDVYDPATGEARISPEATAWLSGHSTLLPRQRSAG